MDPPPINTWGVSGGVQKDRETSARGRRECGRDTHIERGERECHIERDIERRRERDSRG